MTKLEKKDGNVEQCPTCHNKIFCRMTKGSDKYPAKLQWQNEDGTAHYSFDFATKTTSCKSTTTTVSAITLTMPKSEGTDKAVLERFSRDSETIAKQKIAKYIGVKKACDDSGITNPAMIGMIFNAVDKEEL